MATYQITAPDGNKYKLTGPDDASQQDLINALLTQHPMAGQTTQQLEAAKAAPFSFGDTARSLGSGVVGGVKSLSDVFGAGSDISKGLGEAQDYLQQGISPERKAEMARRQELQNRAAESGSLFQEAKAFLGGVAEAPIQSLAQAAGSSAPAIIAGIAALPAEAPAALALGVGTIAKFAVGAMQGVGEMKGGVFDAVKAEYKRQGKTDAEAEALAIKSSEYSRDTALQTGGAALLGALDAATGVEPSVGKAMRAVAPTGKLTREAIEAGIKALPEKALKAPTYGKQILKGIAEEAPLEGAQGAFGQYGENVAMQQAGADVTPMQGVLGAGLRDAAVGALFGGVGSPLSMKSARQEYATDQFLREAKAQQEQDKQAADELKKKEETRAKTEQDLNVPKMLALPAPAKAAEEEKDPLQNPVGRVTEDELGKAIGNNTVVNYLNKYRRDNNLPKLKSYSIEDIKDAMTAQNPEGEEGALNAILAYKTNYQNESYTPEDIQNRAVAKNVATETKGFSDFLTRATGKSDLNTMTQPELHSVATALDALPRTGKEQQLVLPEGSNATRFTQDQYNQGVTQALMNVKEGKPVTLDQAREAIKAQTDLKTDRDADHLLKTAASNEDLIVEKGTGFQAVSPGGVVLGTYGTEAEAKRNHRRADILPVDTQLVRAPEEVNQEKVAQLPEGYEINKKTVAGEAGPAAYVVREDGSQTNASQTFADEADAKDRLNILARKREANAVAEEAAADRIRQDLEKRQSKIAQMEADGQTDTAEHKNAVAAFQAANVAGSAKITEHLDKAEAFRKPLKIVPLGKKTAKVEKHTVIKKGKEVASFPDRVKAEQHILSSASETELQAIADRGGVFGKRAQTELQDRQRTEPGIKVKGTAEGLEKAGVRTAKVEAQLAELKAQLLPMLKQFGLEQVGLNIVREIENDASGAWGKADKLIRIALKAKDPIKTMRHEALHALKELGFFTPQQWEALKREAKKTWVDKYLKGTPFNKTASRYDAYSKGLQDADGNVVFAPLSEEDILEEAIADAFGAWEGGEKPPPGLMAALFKRLQSFFAALRQALTGAGFESADDIFGKIERGELKAGKEAAGTEEKMSLSGIGVPMSTRNLMEVQTPVAQQELGLNTEAKRGRFNSVRQIATALNNFTKTNLGSMQAGDLTSSEATQIAKAIADEVGYQLKATAKTGTGKGWYSTNYPNAVKLLSNRFPELGTSQHARSVFSAIVAVTSNGEKVAKNIANAIKLYSKLRDGKQMVAMNNRRGTALVNNLRTIHKLLDAHGENFEKVLLKEITVKDMNAELKAMGEKADNSYLANTTVPAAAVYFGPKLGAFYANLSGAEGYLTMDLWWTRSINRMRGLLMPQATEASINKFRDMMDRPEATRDEVIAATIPLRNKYKEYGYNTELEYLVGSKEPRTNDKRPAWFKRAEEKAGDAYEQLLFDHNAEKMANTIYKNEYEMLEEAPFNASDRKFMYDAARQAQNMLRKEGVDLSLADVQAALWYYEKRLYEKLSGRKADDIGYEEAIIEQSKQGTGRARPSVVFDRGYGGGAESRRESGQADEVRGQPTGTQREQGVSGEQKLSLGENAGRISFVSPAYDERKLGETGNRRRRLPGGGYSPLEGAPVIEGATGPDPSLVSVAESYAAKNGINLKPQTTYVDVDEDRAKRLAQAYDEMPHNPNDPEVKEAYREMIKQVRDQYDALIDAGYKFTFFDGDTDPYSGNPWNAMRDLRNNKEMAVYGTYDGFGTEGITDKAIEDNPMLEDTGLRWEDQKGVEHPVTANDLFRAVHDAFGHGLEGAGFRARGEENAWQAHARLFKGKALAALTSETRGQNSWLNYGPYSEKNKTAKVLDTVFADQKTGLMPEWTWTEGLDNGDKYSLSFSNEALKPISGNGIVLGEKQDNAKSFVGLHYGQNKVTELSGSKYGTGIRGAERRRLADTDDQRIKKRIYFYIPKEDGTMPRQEAGLGGHVYTQQFDNIAAGPVVDRLFSEAGGDANQFESNVVDAGYDGYAMPNMGMMVILNHNTPVQYHGTMGELAESDKKFSLRAAPDTPEFKRWFGNSDAVDKDGKPLIVYTATNKDFTVFEPGRGASKDAIAAWVTSDKDFVNNYASVRYRYWKTMHRPWEEDQMIPNGVHIVPAYVNPKNPLDVTNLISDLAAPINDSEAEKVADQLQVSKDDLLDAIPEKDIYPNGRERDHTRISSDLVRTKFAVDAMRRLGFDSVKARESGASVYALFDSDQIKSAISNKGTYSGPDIRYSLRTYFPTAEEAENAAYKKAPPGTPEFKRFFGASKVMEEGRAQPMYHASMEEFNIFRENRPIFISPDAGFAEDFIKRRMAESGSLSYLSEGEVKKKTAKIYPLWVRAETPFDYDNKMHVQKVVDYLQANNQVSGGRIQMGGLGLMTPQEITKGLSQGKWTVIEDGKTQEALKVLGFDSFYTAEGGAKNLAVFKANQVKSVTGNIGDFSENKSIKYSLPVVPADIDARVNETTQTREHKGFIERILDVFKPESLADLRASFIHRYNQLGVYDKMLADKVGDRVLMADMSAEAAANMSDLSASVTYAAFGIGNRKGGIPVYKNGMTTIDTSTKGPLQILSPLAQFNDPKAYQHYQFWAGVKRGSRFMAETSPSGVVSYREKNFEPADIEKAERLRKQYKDKGVDFTVIQKEMNTFNDGLVDYMMATGVLAPERAAEFKKHMDYIPFYRQLNGEETVGPKIFNSISGVKPPKKLKGGEAPLTDYLESIVQNTQAAINAGMKNMAAQRAINVAMQLGKTAGAEKISGVSSAHDAVTVLEKGKPVSYRVADPLFINAVKSLNMAEIPFMGMFSAPSNLLRNLVTKDPGFMLANLARDSLSAWVTSGTKMTPIAGTVANFTKALGGKDPILHALFNAGILGGYEFSSGVIKSGEVLEKDLNKRYGSSGKAAPLKVFNGVWEALEKGTEASDAATRMAVYERVLAETGNETEAIYRALEVMNFNRKGSSPVVRILTAAIPFLNARIQGLDVFYRTAMGRNVSADAEAMQKAFFVRGATLMALSAAYFLAVSDDDEWKKQEQETKDNYWIAPGIGKFPTPFEVGFLFKTMPERILAYTMKDDTGQDFMASMQRGLLNTFAFNPIPQVAKPFIEYNANYNFFTGRPIVGQGMEGLETQYQVGPNTTKVMEFFGKQLGLSPIKLEQLYNSYTGTMGMYALTTIDSVLDSQSNSPNASKRFEQLPIIKRFAADPEARGNITQFYELKKSVEAAVQTQNFLLKSARPEEYADFIEKNKGLLAVKPYIANIEKAMKQTREMRKMIQGADMSGDEKKDLLTELGRRENNITSNIQTVKKMVSEF